jgi:hypothetical protein
MEVPKSNKNKKDVPLSRFSKDVSSIGSGINDRGESDPIYKTRQDVSILKIPNGIPLLKKKQNFTSSDYDKYLQAVNEFFNDPNRDENDYNHCVILPKIVDNDVILKGLKNSDKTHICVQMDADNIHNQDRYMPAHNVYDQNRSKWLSLNEINKGNENKSPSNATKNLFAHAIFHIQQFYSGAIVGSVFDILLNKYSSSVAQSNIIISAFRQRLAFTGNTILGSDYGYKMLTQYKNSKLTFLPISESEDAHNMYAAITLLLTNALTETLLKPKESAQIDYMKLKLKGVIWKYVISLGEEKALEIFKLTTDRFVLDALNQIIEGYGVDDQIILTDKLFETGDNLKLAEFIENVKTMTIENIYTL